MRKQKIYTAGESSRRIVKKLTLMNLAVIALLFALCVIFLNVYATSETHRRIDVGMTRHLSGFTQSHLSPEIHSQRLPRGLLPIIFFRDAQGGYMNPHPAEQMVQEDIDILLARRLPEGLSNQSVSGRTYRVNHSTYETPLTFWEEEKSYSVSETASFLDTTSEEEMLDSLRWASALCFVVSIVAFGLFSYANAKRTIVPINKAWEKQRQFAADTSHELRNPLAIIQTNAELLLQSPEHSIRAESTRISAILDSSGRMSSMLSSLLTLARADADSDELLYEHVCISELLKEVSEQYRQIGEVKKVSVSFSIEPGLSVVGDRRRLFELFSIFLDNAIRYTEPGGNIQVKCSKERVGLTVCIRDTGIGMSDEDIRAVFQRFYRSNRARFMNPEGMGLGLSIAQWIAERHYAEIKAESIEGEGTAMLLTFKNADVLNTDSNIDQ